MTEQGKIKKTRPPLGPDHFFRNPGEGDETVSINGCRMTCIKEVFSQQGVIVKRKTVITDLGIQKRNGHVYRLYDVKETETETDEI